MEKAQELNNKEENNNKCFVVRGYPYNWKIHEKRRRKSLTERPTDRN